MSDREDSEDPFNPDEFGDMFAEALSELADEGTEVDTTSDIHAFICFVTVNGIDYEVTVKPVGLDERD